MFLDFHSHVLPGIDDGAKDLATSLAMLGEMQRQGTSLVLATPHFCLSNGSIEEFIARRDEAYGHLMAAVEATGAVIPKILRGAEVLLSTELAEQPDLSRLCIEGTRCILLEMPYGPWRSWMVNTVYEVQNAGFYPIMAHLERYFRFSGNEEWMDDLLSSGLAVQMNAGSIVNRERQRFCLKLIKYGIVDVLGSDAHNMDSRPPQYKEAVAIIRKKLGDAAYQRIEQNGQELLELKLR